MANQRKPIAVFFIIILAHTHTAHAQPDMRGYGVGLSHTDSAEVITFLARESPLRDIDIVVGDEVVAIGGRRIDSKDILVHGLVGEYVDTVSIQIHRPSNGLVFSATIAKTVLRKGKVERFGMLDKGTAYIRLQVFDADDVESLEAALDSLATGSDGRSLSSDITLTRLAEACGYLYKLNPYRHPTSTSSLFTTDNFDAYQADVNAYLDDKYGWKMQTLILDVRGDAAKISREVLRSIRLFCEERRIALVREI